MLYNPLIKSKGQIAIVSEQTGMMTVSDFFNLDWEKKKPKHTSKNRGTIMSNTMAKNTFWFAEKFLCINYANKINYLSL